MGNINQTTNLFFNIGGMQYLAKQQTSETSSLNKNTNSETSNFSNNKSEKFKEVCADFHQNVPDSTSTIAEKELAISYINRMLACEDIPDDLKIYWQNKKAIIQMEIQNIKNDKNIGSGEKVAEVWTEYKEFIQKYQGNINTNMSADEQYEYLMTYNRTGQSFTTRLMNCIDVTKEQLVDFKEMYKNFENDIQNCRRDFSIQKNKYQNFYYPNFNISKKD